MNVLHRDSRGVSTALGYVMTISITMLLITGLITATGNTFERESNRAATEELSTVGNRLAGEILAVGRLSATGEDATVALTTVYPERVAGKQYYINLKTTGAACSADGCLVLNTTDDEISVVVPFSSETPIEETRVAGGDVVVTYDPATGKITLAEEQ